MYPWVQINTRQIYKGKCHKYTVCRGIIWKNIVIIQKSFRNLNTSSEKMQNTSSEMMQNWFTLSKNHTLNCEFWHLSRQAISTVRNTVKHAPEEYKQPVLTVYCVTKLGCLVEWVQEISVCLKNWVFSAPLSVCLSRCQPYCHPPFHLPFLVFFHTGYL